MNKFPLIYPLFLSGYIFSTGIYNHKSLVILTLSLLLLIFFQPKTVKHESLTITLIISLLFSLFTERLLYPAFPQVNLVIKIVIIFLFLISLLYLTKHRFYIHQYLFLFFMTVGIFLHVFVIMMSPEPKIDVYYLLKEAPINLLNGINPYSAIYTKVYPAVNPDYYSYLPLSIFFFIPFSFFLKDPRWLYLLVYFLDALIIYKVVKDKLKAELLILIILFQPLSFLVFEQGFLEILLIGLITTFAYFLNKKNINLAAFLLGLAIAVKQTIILIIPFVWSFFFNKNKKINNLVYLSAPSVFTITPFLIWNFKDFWYDVVYTLLAIDRIRPDMVGFSLNYLTLSLKIFNFYPPLIPFYSLIVLILIYFILRKRLFTTCSVSMQLSNFVLFFLLFHLLATQAYVNYFFLMSNLLILSQVFVETRS